MTGGPLKYAQRPLLFNTVTSDDIGYFTDSVRNIRMLHFKKHGLTLPAKQGSTLVGSWTKGSYYPGSRKNINFVLSPSCPCESCNYSYAITVYGEVKDPGIFNSQFAPEGRTYGGRIELLGTCSNGVIADSDIVNIENDILDQVTNDNGLGAYSGAKSGIVEARRYYIVTVTSNLADFGFTITKPDGTTITVLETHVDATTGVFGTTFNADATVNTLFTAVRIGDDTYMVISKAAGYKFTIGTLVNMTSSERGLNFRAKEVDERFYLNYEFGFGTVKDLYWFEIIDSAATFAQNETDLSIFVDGVDHNETNSTGAGATNLVTDINVAQQTGHNLYASTDSTSKVIIAGYELATTVWIEVDSTSGSGISCVAYTPKGDFTRLTADDVWREFGQLGNYGPLTSQVRQELPNNVPFNRYVIRSVQDTYGLHGASHGASYQSEVICYVAKAYASIFETALTNWLS